MSGFEKSSGAAISGTQFEKFSVVQSINNDTLTTLTNFEAAADYSQIPGVTFVPATGQLTLPAGFYQYFAQVQFADPGAASVGYRLMVDGFGFTNTQIPIGAAQAPTKLMASGGGFLASPFTAAAIQVRHTQGVALNVTFAMFTVYKVR